MRLKQVSTEQAKAWVVEHVIPLFESATTVFRLMFIVVFVYMMYFCRDLMETVVEVPLQVLLALYLLLGLPNLIDAVCQFWRFLRTMGEIEPPRHADLEGAL